MAVLQRISFEPNERLDTPDARSLEAFSLNDWRFFMSGFFSPTSYVLTGFEISNYATIFTVPGFQLTLNDVVLFHSQASTQAAGFYVFAGTEQNAAISLSPSATNYVEATLTNESGTPDVRAFWDESANGGQGGEFTDTIDTVIDLKLEVLSNITGFTTGNIPLYKVVTNSSGIVTSVQDCRNLFFRLGTGGNSPNPNNSFAYPNFPDSTHARLETPITATSATVSNAPYQGGDKNITDFKQWMDAVMSAIKELKSTPYWYSPLLGGSGIASIYQNAALTLLDGGVWTQNPAFLKTTGSVLNGSNQLTGLAGTSGARFTVTSANATAGATYTNNGATFTVFQTITAGTTLLASFSSGSPTSSGVLTKTGGSGDATITFSSVITTAIVGGDVQIVEGVDIPNVPATTVSSIVGTTVTMSANAIGTNASEIVSFLRAAGGQLELSTEANIHRLGYTTPRLFLTPFFVDLAVQPDLWVLLPDGDYVVTYGYGQDGLTPIVPEQVTSSSSSTISVNVGGNYVSGGGKILVHGQTFTYTSYTPGTGLFAGVTPDPSGIVQVNDYAYQLDQSGTAYYHYSSQDAVPSIVNGTSMGVERVFWIAHFDAVSSESIVLRIGQILPGETISSPSSSITDILSYIGSPGPGFSSPQYTVTATGALNSQTNYNSSAGEDLTTRLSKITTMMADKAQDKTIGLLASGFTKIVNTTSGPNQLLTFTGGGSMVVAMPGSANNGSIGLSSTLTLGTLQAAYFQTNRNASFTVSNLSALTVASITAVPINENIRIFAYRLSDNNIYLWDGTIIPVGDVPTPSQLSLEIQQNLNSKLIAGGTWSWNSGTSTLTWSATANIAVPGLADSVNQISAGSAVLADGDIAWVTINRTGPGGTLTVSTGAESSATLTDEFWVLARRTGTDVLVGHSFRLTNGESKLLDQGISNQNLTYIGAATEASSSPTYSSTTFITNGDSLTTAAGKLDARATSQQLFSNQARSMFLISGGTWAWSTGTNQLTWSAQANIAIPGLADSVNVIAAGSATLTDGQVAYVNYNATGPGGTLTVTVVAESSLTPTDSTAVFARRVGTTVYVGLKGEMLLQNGESKELFAGLSIQNRSYIGISTEATSAPTYSSVSSGSLNLPDFNAVANEDLTTRLSKVTAMLADVRQDLNINTDSGSVVWDGTNITVTGASLSIPGTTVGAAPVSINTFGPTALAANSCLYVDISRTSGSALTLTSSTISALTPSQQRLIVFRNIGGFILTRN